MYGAKTSTKAPAGFVLLKVGEKEKRAKREKAVRKKYCSCCGSLIDNKTKKCTGCGKCVKGCTSFGNGSLYLQIKQDICVNCNECQIAQVCVSDAISRVDYATAYKLKE